jgi:ectoine hydroxylase-related dioxygenase (phytanoyl-CoA dioxygenase family)
MTGIRHEIAMRTVTDDEAAFYKENGWVYLPQLIPRELADELRTTVQQEIEGAEAELVEGQHVSGGHIRDRADRRDWHFIGRDDHVEPFQSLIYSKQIGENAHRLIGRDVRVNYHADLMAVKMPEGHAASKPTGWHQDWVNFPFDRIGFLTFWFALGEIPPERGSMRFLNGSHRAGPLGKMGLLGGKEVIEYYPELLEEYEMSPPLDMQPGDATVHNGMCVHGAPENSTDQPRWAYIASYHPADTCYTGAPHYIFSPDVGLEVGKPIKADIFRVVYPQ